MGHEQDSPQQEMQDEMEFDEMDLTPYEEDDDATLHKKLCAAKVARKRAEEDLKLLCNRIGLLKMEEGKVSEKAVIHQSNSFHVRIFLCRLSKRLTKLASERHRSSLKDRGM